VGDLLNWRSEQFVSLAVAGMQNQSGEASPAATVVATAERGVQSTVPAQSSQSSAVPATSATDRRVRPTIVIIGDRVLQECADDFVRIQVSRGGTGISVVVHEHPAAVLVDYGLPEVWIVCRILRKLCGNELPLFVLADSEQRDAAIRHALWAGASALVSGPREICAAIANLQRLG
jgi:CheY-like chemotaxis protein